MRRALLLLPIIVLAALVAGCSDDVTKERDYADGVLAAKRSIDKAYDDVFPDGIDKASSVEQTSLLKLQRAAREASVKVEQLDPPSDLEDEDERIVAAFQQISKGIDEIVATRDKAIADRTRNKQKSDTGSADYLEGSVELKVLIDQLRATR